MSVRRRVGAELAVAFVALALAAKPALAAPSLRDGAAAYAAGRLPEAEVIFRQSVARRPSDSHAWLWLGVVEFQLQRYIEAEQAFAHAARLVPKSAVVWLWWGHLLVRTARADQAEAMFHRALLGWGTPKMYELARQALRTIRPLPALAEGGARAASGGAGPTTPTWVLRPESYRFLARHYNPRLTIPEADRIGGALLGYSRHFNMDPRLVVALIVVESGFHPRAVSKAGAMGLGQLMPSTARALRVDPWDPVQNLYGSIRYLRGNLDRFGWENTHLALAAYNAGRGAVELHEGIPPYAETQFYVANVTSLYRRLMVVSGGIAEVR